MKAKDTVMNILEIDNITGDEAPCSNCPTPDGDCNDCYLSRIADAQAEISFKAGIKEIVEWIQSHFVAIKDKDDWQSKLKSWGID